MFSVREPTKMASPPSTITVRTTYGNARRNCNEFREAGPFGRAAPSAAPGTPLTSGPLIREEAVAVSANGFDAPRTGGLIFDFLPEPAYMNVDGAGLHRKVIPPHFSKKGRTRNHDPRMPSEIVQQIEFF